MSKLLSNSLNNNQSIVSSKSLSQLFIEDFQIQHGKTLNSDVPKRKQEPKKITLYTLYFLDLLLSHVIVGKRKFHFSFFGTPFIVYAHNCPIYDIKVDFFQRSKRSSMLERGLGLESRLARDLHVSRWHHLGQYSCSDHWSHLHWNYWHVPSKYFQQILQGTFICSHLISIVQYVTSL